MRFISEILKGVLIGAGYILPGVSSGVLCVIFGIYEKLLDSILNFFKDIKKNFMFLLPIALGAGIGILIFSRLINYLFYEYPIQTKSLFVGLILGSVPSVIKQANSKNGFKAKNIIYLVISFIVGIFLVYLEQNIAISSADNINYIYLIFSGILMAAGVVIPGVSSTVILMILGVYSLYLNSISYLNLNILIPIGFGLVIGCLIFMKIIKILLDKCYDKTFYAIIGFTLGSVFVLFPEIEGVLEGLICILCILLGYIILNLKIFNK